MTAGGIAGHSTIHPTLGEELEIAEFDLAVVVVVMIEPTPGAAGGRVHPALDEKMAAEQSGINEFAGPGVLTDHAEFIGIVCMRRRSPTRIKHHVEAHMPARLKLAHFVVN